MPVLNSIAAFSGDLSRWRRQLHTRPELSFDCHETAGFVEARLREFGITEIETGIARTGLVAVIEGQGPGPTIGLRADMDALPIAEATGLPHASEIDGKMHACGHDGHTTMLLGAARYLAETRNFAGRVALIFQPAEETGGGGGVMVEEGILERYDIREVYALHTLPGAPVGHFTTTPGPILAAVDSFDIVVKGRGGHAAMPHDTSDPIMAAVSIVQALQTIVTRNHDATEDLVLSVTQIHAGTSHNIVPDAARINGTVRSFTPEVRAMAERRMAEVVAGQAASFGVEARLSYNREEPPTVNDPDSTAFAARVAAQIAPTDAEAGRSMGAEDFAYMLEARPGAYLYVGNGDSAPLHHPEYDFNDESAPYGASFFARLVETALPLEP